MTTSPDLPAPNPVLDALRDAAAGLDDVAGRSMWSLSDADVTQVLEAARELAARVDSVAVAAVAEAAARGITGRSGASSTTAWLRTAMRVRGTEGHRLACLATAFTSGRFDATHDALTDGQISVDHAAVIVRSVEALPSDIGSEARAAAEGFLLEQARRLDPADVARLGSRVRHVIDPDGADRALGRRLDRTERDAGRSTVFNVYPEDGGGCRLSGRLDAEGASLLGAALDPLMRPVPTADGRDPRPAPQRRAEALLELCRRALTADQLPDHGGRRPTIVVTVDLDHLRAQIGAATLDTGTVLGPAAVRRLACDAAILPAVLDGAGCPLDLGRARRLISGPLRSALVLRDRGCAFPSCDRPPAWCDGHHIVHWADDGPTSLANAVLLCGHHHRLLHHGDWDVRLGLDGRPEFRPPSWIAPDRRWQRNEIHRT